MKSSENVEIKSNEVKTTNSRASRMSRYSTAAAGVAAVSAVDVDAAMIKVIITDPNAQGLDANYSYTLDLDNIRDGAEIKITVGASPTWEANSLVQMAQTNYSEGSNVAYFGEGEVIGSGGGTGGWEYLGGSVFGSTWAGSSLYEGFRVLQEGGSYTYGWLNVDTDGIRNNSVRSYGYNSTLNEAAIAGQGAVSDNGPGIFGIALIGAGAAGVRLWRKLRAGK